MQITHLTDQLTISIEYQLAGYLFIQVQQINAPSISYPPLLANIVTLMMQVKFQLTNQKLLYDNSLFANAKPQDVYFTSIKTYKK